MPESSTTAGDNPQNGDATADSTTAQDPKTATDNQPADKGDNLDASKSTDDASASADGDKKPADDSANNSAEGDKTPASTFDSDIEDWIDKRGLPKPENDEQKQKYQDLRNSQREYTREQQAKKDAGDLGSAVKDAKSEVKSDPDDDDAADPLEKDVKNLQSDLAEEREFRLQSEFYTTNQVTTEQHKHIMDILKEKVGRPSTPEGKKAALDYWGNPQALPDLLDLANARIAKSTDTVAVADEAARTERERIAQESNASSTSRNAKSTTADSKTTVEERNERLLKKYS